MLCVSPIAFSGVARAEHDPSTRWILLRPADGTQYAQWLFDAPEDAAAMAAAINGALAGPVVDKTEAAARAAQAARDAGRDAWAAAGDAAAKSCRDELRTSCE